MRGSSQASHLRGACGSIARIVVIPYRRKGLPEAEIAVIQMDRIRTLIRDVVAMFLIFRWGSPRVGNKQASKLEGQFWASKQAK